MSKEYCCLKRIGAKSKKNMLVMLEGKTKIVVGRSLDANVCIVSNMISRKHAVLSRQNDGSWTVQDNKSINGVFVNEKKLVPGKNHTLEDGDMIQFGVRSKADEPAEWLYKYYTHLRIQKSISHDQNSSIIATLDSEKGSQDSDIHSHDKIAEINNCKDCVTSTSCSGIRKRKSDCFEEDLDGKELSSHDPNIASSSKSPESHHRKKLHSSSASSLREEKFREQERLAAEKLKEQERMLQEMQAEIKQREAQQQQLEQQLREKESLLQEQLQQQTEQLDRDRKEFEEKMRLELEEALKTREDYLLEQLKSQQSELEVERTALIQRLEAEMSDRLVEKDKNVLIEEELRLQKEKLDKVIEMKEVEQRVLKKQLEDTSTENERHKEGMLKAREDVLSNFANLMETELQCSICNELFIQATSLNCSHSFCALCLEQWMEQKKECPVCRAAISSTVRSIVLDSYIDRMVEQLSEDMKKEREQLVAERKAEQTKRDDAKAAASSSAGRGRGGRGRRGARGRGGTGSPRGRGRGAGRGAAAMRQTVLTPIYVESDSDSDSDDNSLDDVDLEMEEELEMYGSDSDSSVEGEMGAYYGGYGECYHCRRRGHWANGCPYR